MDGNLAGLKPNELKALQRLTSRRYDPHAGYTLEQAKELGALSRLISRQIGLLIDRQGKVELTIVGDAHGILIPTLARERSTGRLRGIRLLHTHLTDSRLSNEDLMDLLFLRLDSIGVLTVDEFGAPVHFQSAHLLPALISDESYIKDISKGQAKKQKHLDFIEQNQEENTNLHAEDIDFILTQNLYRAEIGKPSPKPLQGSPNEPYRISEFFDWDKNPLDLQAEIEALEEEFARLFKSSRSTENSKNQPKYNAKGSLDTYQAGSRCVLVSVSKAPKSIQERNLAELAELARTAGLGVCGSLIQRVAAVNPRQILSQNKLAELEVIALQGHAGIIIFDGELSPAQLQNLAELTERKVLDRTQLILDIFAQHAKTGAGKLQVEMAQLKYTQPRLVGKNRAMDRLMGGIGGRGPGETKLETDRRRVKDRIAKIKIELENLKKQRQANRAKRNRFGLPVAALVGYTNAGKSTLLNKLTKSEVIAENKLFATLDPTTRRLRFPEEHEIVLADTVGFIRDLPKELMEAFRATLEELNEADILLHVIDASHEEMEQQLESVESILEELKLSDVPRILLLNKWDNVDKNARSALLERFGGAYPISAVTGFGLAEASSAIEKRLFGTDGSANPAERHFSGTNLSDILVEDFPDLPETDLPQ